MSDTPLLKHPITLSTHPITPPTTRRVVTLTAPTRQPVPHPRIRTELGRRLRLTAVTARFRRGNRCFSVFFAAS